MNQKKKLTIKDVKYTPSEDDLRKSHQMLVDVVMSRQPNIAQFELPVHKPLKKYTQEEMEQYAQERVDAAVESIVQALKSQGINITIKTTIG